jgi:hypothetical protein
MGVKVGVTEVILAVNYQPQVMSKFLEEKEKEVGGLQHLQC